MYRTDDTTIKGDGTATPAKSFCVVQGVMISNGVGVTIARPGSWRMLNLDDLVSYAGD